MEVTSDDGVTSWSDVCKIVVVALEPRKGNNLVMKSLNLKIFEGNNNNNNCSCSTGT